MSDAPPASVRDAVAQRRHDRRVLWVLWGVGPGIQLVALLVAVGLSAGDAHDLTLWLLGAGMLALWTHLLAAPLVILMTLDRALWRYPELWAVVLHWGLMGVLFASRVVAVGWLVLVVDLAAPVGALVRFVRRRRRRAGHLSRHGDLP